MTPTTIKPMIACLLAVALGSATALQAEPRPDETTPPAAAGPETLPLTPRAPAGFVLVDEGLWTQHHDQPARAFEEACASLTQHDAPAAAAALRRAAGYVRAEGSRTADTMREHLQAVSTALSKAATEVADGRLTEVQALSRLFANAHHQIARHHLMLARRALDERDAPRTGEHLLVALDNRREELNWLDRELDPEAVREFKRIEELATGLRDGAVELDAQAELAVRNLEGALRL
jgi:hypothetical protein